jgi:uncharacterized protein YcbK (DUF882 family)
MNAVAPLLSLALLASSIGASTAHAADDLPKKLAFIDQKKKAPAASPQERARLDKKLAKIVGKPPAALINVRNGWTDEWLVFEPRKDYEVSQETWDMFLRCHFTNQPTQMDRRLVGVLIGAAIKFKKNRIDIVSGYRAPKFNLQLRKKGHEVARQSQHSEGNAVDFRLPGVTTPALLSYVRSLRLGGAGFYPESKFVHADTGPVRYWTGR